MADKKSVETITGFLDLALEIEDEMSKSVYGAYLKRKAWPSDLSDEAFEAITNSLMILINETEDHRLRFRQLKEKYEKH
ncbi:MAG: hypothetical protein HY443_01825 [Candidatus Nealsonbacteria bacterium]|nr:hypothetical protein [Candidatus Nealsonbacteria bacterium]